MKSQPLEDFKPSLGYTDRQNLSLNKNSKNQTQDGEDLSLISRTHKK